MKTIFGSTLCVSGIKYINDVTKIGATINTGENVNRQPSIDYFINTHKYTHTHMCVCVCVCKTQNLFNEINNFLDFNISPFVYIDFSFNFS